MKEKDTKIYRCLHCKRKIDGDNKNSKSHCSAYCNTFYYIKRKGDHFLGNKTYQVKFGSVAYNLRKLHYAIENNIPYNDVKGMILEPTCLERTCVKGSHNIALVSTQVNPINQKTYPVNKDVLPDTLFGISHQDALHEVLNSSSNPKSTEPSEMKIDIKEKPNSITTKNFRSFKITSNLSDEEIDLIIKDVICDTCTNKVISKVLGIVYD